jgi:hypothetical protein
MRAMRGFIQVEALDGTELLLAIAAIREVRPTTGSNTSYIRGDIASYSVRQSFSTVCRLLEEAGRREGCSCGRGGEETS